MLQGYEEGAGRDNVQHHSRMQETKKRFSKLEGVPMGEDQQQESNCSEIQHSDTQDERNSTNTQL